MGNSKIVFLDIDGVCTSWDCSYMNPPSMYALNKRCIARIKRILDETGAKIVWITNWRTHTDNLWETHRGTYHSLLPQAREIFKDYILDDAPHIHGRMKFYDVEEWLSNNSDKCDHFVIIDDQYTQGLEGFGENFHRTAFETGITDKDADEIISFLNEIDS